MPELWPRMRGSLRILVLLLLCVPGTVHADSPCLPDDLEVVALDAQGGVGGTGETMEPGGIGGTGRGGVGGTGIWGTITALGSICVNGLLIETDASPVVVVRGRPGSVAELAVGQTVWVEAGARDGRLVARSISVYSAVQGIVTAVDAKARRLRIADEEVQLPDGLPVVGVGADLPLAALVGSFLEVSGLPKPDGGLQVSRVEARARRGDEVGGLPDVTALIADREIAFLSLEGFVSQRAKPLRIQLQRVELELAAPARVERGDRVWTTSRVREGAPPRALRLAVRPERAPRPEVLRPPQRPEARDVQEDPRPVRPERPERPERPPRIEKPVRPVRPERPEQPERPRPADVLPDLPVRKEIEAVPR